jgi:putative serine protease PepD
MHYRPLRDPMSEVRHSYQDSAQPRRGSVRALLLPAFTLAVISAAVGAAVAVLAFPSEIVSYASSESNATSSLEQVAAKVLPSLVTLKTDLGGGALQEGSGIILTRDGLIMTNAHVVATAADAPQGPSSTTVAFNDGRTAPFRMVATDPESDIAVVRAEGMSGLTAIAFGSSADLHVGQQVIAVGSPLDLSGTITVGVVSALNRPVFGLAAGTNQAAAYDAIQTDAALNPGNSGGALVDTNGKLIGINSAMASMGGHGGGAGTPSGSIGIGFAIPVGHAAHIANELFATGTASHAWLGAQATTESDCGGARIIDVTGGSPATEAGLPDGAPLTKVDDQVVRNAGALYAAVQSQAPGTRMAVRFLDPAGDPEIIFVTLGSDHGRP